MVLCLAAIFPWAAIGQVAENADIAVGVTDSFDIPTNGLGSWIWAANTHDRQTCQLWRSFEIPAGARVRSARIRLTADNEHTLFSVFSLKASRKSSRCAAPIASLSLSLPFCPDHLPSASQTQ
jgi:hypothetical protein